MKSAQTTNTRRSSSHETGKLSQIGHDVMILFGSGGHSTEMLMLIQNAKLAEKVKRREVGRVVCVISEDDIFAEDKINTEFGRCKQWVEITRIKRSRRVGQSYLTAIWTTIIGVLQSLHIIFKYKPKICLTNGPAISVSISVAIQCLQKITFGKLFKCKIIYIESFCRTKTLSLSGKLIYHLRLASEFYVQWQDLSILYPRANYKGLLV